MSDPCRRRDNIFKAVRAAAGALRGIGTDEMAVMVMAFGRSEDEEADQRETGWSGGAGL